MSDIAIDLPFEPDYIEIHKYGLCFLCKGEKENDKNFDNSTCPHCKKLDKGWSWMVKKSINPP